MNAGALAASAGHEWVRLRRPARHRCGGPRCGISIIYQIYCKWRMFISSCVHFNTPQYVAHLKCFFVLSWGSKDWGCHQGIDLRLAFLGYLSQTNSTLLKYGKKERNKQKSPSLRHDTPSAWSAVLTRVLFFTEQARKPSVSQKQCNPSYYQKRN